MSGPSQERRVRRAARVLVVSTENTVLLLRGGDPGRPDAGTWWFTPGGGLEEGETPEQAARRELAEETGLERHDFGAVVLQRTVEFEFDGVVYEQSEDYFVVRAEQFSLDTSRWSPIEVATVVEHRWWSLEELRTTQEQVYPEGLPDLLQRLIA